MTTLQPELQAFRYELRAAVEADLGRHRGHRRRLRRGIAFGTPAGLAALGISLTLVLGAGSGLSSADAAILTSAQTALTPPPASVFHVAATITVGSSPAQPYELWTTGSSYRFMKFGYEAAWNDRRCPAMTPPPTPFTSGSTALRVTPSTWRPPSAPSSRRARRTSTVRQSWTGSPLTSCHYRGCLQAAGLPMAPTMSQRATTTPCSLRRPWPPAGTVSRDRAVPDLRVPATDCCQSLPARSERTTPRRDRRERARRC